MTLARPPVDLVLQQHQEEAAGLCAIRQVLVEAPHVRLHQLRRIDERIAAHLDGLAVAGEAGSRLCEAALVSPGVGEVFAATVRAVLDRNAAWLARLLSLAELEKPAQTGLLAALGWVSAVDLRGITRELLVSPSAFQRQVGLAACRMHQVDPGPALAAALGDARSSTPGEESVSPALRRRALRVAGESGRLDLLPRCLQALDDEDAACRHEAARAALLLGDRGASLAVLGEFVGAPGPWRREALRLWFAAASPVQARSRLKALAARQAEPAGLRALIQAIGVAGDAHFVPWLIQQMAELRTARLAGESFALLTGLDLAGLDLERKPPEALESGPDDDPDEVEVALDEDDSLPWPDPARIAAWWQAQGSRYTPGVRHFLGELPSAAVAQRGLKDGFQRQRAAAARERCLLQPGTALFPTAALAWRQQRALAASAP